MAWRLYLDDERSPKTNGNWEIARSYSEAISLIETRGCPEYISFDHDLGCDVPTGKDLANWIINEDLSGNLVIPANFDFNVHSANPVGRDNIMSIMNSYINFKKGFKK